MARFPPLLVLALTFTPGAALAQTGALFGRVEATPARYLAETVVFLREVRPDTPRPLPRKVSMDEKGLRFIPHVLAVNVGDTVVFLNNDPVEHNVFTPDHEGYNLGMIQPSSTGSYLFERPGVYTQLCSVHSEMLAYVFVGESPWHAVVDARGAWRLDGVPAGTWTVAVWNSHLKAPDAEVTVVAGKATEVRFVLKR